MSDDLHGRMRVEGWDDLSLWEQISLLPEDEQEEAIRDLLRRGVDLDSYEVLLRPKQKKILESDEPIILFQAGRGCGKTFCGSAWVNTYALEHPGCRIALVGRTVSDVRDTMVLGESGIINKAPKDFVPIYTPSIRHLEWPNGSTATTYAAVVPDLMRGPQQDATWCDELATFPTKPDASGATMWDNVVMATRLGDNPQILSTTTPKRVPILYRLEEMAKNDEGVLIVNGTSWENRSNLSKAYMDQVFAKYAGTYLERQELYGELIGDSEDALWNSTMIEYEDMPEDEELLIVIGVDPAVTVGNDDTGIVVVASDTNPDPYKRRAWVVDDYTMNDHVEKWAETVLEVQRLWSATSAINPTGRPAMVVVEKDHGHDLLGVLFKNAGADLNTTPIVPIGTKGQGKVQRAESIVLAYQQGRVKHDKKLPGLETEMTGWEPRNTKVSPGHIDALVHALRVLLVDPRPIARWAPILTSNEVDYSMQTLGGVSSAWKRDRGVKTGLGTAPWRSRR
jgi:phage terminase large subunit-like protein